MPTPMNAVVILIASPGDTDDERAAVRNALNDWTMENGRREQVAALPWLYEQNAVPKMGSRAQAIINAQAVDQADVVIAIFDSRLGTPTGVNVSGTAEEINRATGLGKPVHVYFSTEDLPRGTDPGQLAAMRDFQSELASKGLLGSYMNPLDLAGQVKKALQHDVDEHGWGNTSPQVARSAGARLSWYHVASGNNQLIVRNEGDVAAEGFEFTCAEVGETMASFDAAEEDEGPVTLHPHSERGWLCIPYAPGTISIHATWSEEGNPQETTRTVTLRAG